MSRRLRAEVGCQRSAPSVCVDKSKRGKSLRNSHFSPLIWEKMATQKPFIFYVPQYEHKVINAEECFFAVTALVIAVWISDSFQQGGRKRGEVKILFFGDKELLSGSDPNLTSDTQSSSTSCTFPAVNWFLFNLTLFHLTFFDQTEQAWQRQRGLRVWMYPIKSLT